MIPALRTGYSQEKTWEPRKAWLPDSGSSVKNNYVEKRQMRIFGFPGKPKIPEIFVHPLAWGGGEGIISGMGRDTQPAKSSFVAGGVLWGFPTQHLLEIPE